MAIADLPLRLRFGWERKNGMWHILCSECSKVTNVLPSPNPWIRISKSLFSTQTAIVYSMDSYFEEFSKRRWVSFEMRSIRKRNETI